MTNNYSMKNQILLESIISFQDEYKDLYDTWKAIDSKAQASATIAGVFLAAVFAIAREIPSTFQQFQRIFLAVAIFLLVITVCLCVFGMQIRKISAPPIGENLKELVNDLLPILTERNKNVRIYRFLRDKIDLWDISNSDLKKICLKKASWIQFGQVCLVIAIIFVTFVTLTVVIA